MPHEGHTIQTHLCSYGTRNRGKGRQSTRDVRLEPHVHLLQWSVATRCPRHKLLGYRGAVVYEANRIKVLPHTCEPAQCYQ